MASTEQGIYQKGRYEKGIKRRGKGGGAYDKVGLQCLTKYNKFELALVGSVSISFSISLPMFSFSSRKSKVKCLAMLFPSGSS